MAFYKVLKDQLLKQMQLFMISFFYEEVFTFWGEGRIGYMGEATLGKKWNFPRHRYHFCRWGGADFFCRRPAETGLQEALTSFLNLILELNIYLDCYFA